MKALALLVLSLPLYGQFSNTLTQNIYTGIQSVPAASVVVNNIGQSAHLLSVRQYGPASGCNVKNILVALEVTTTNTTDQAAATWTPLALVIGDPLNYYSPSVVYYRYATGAFPGIRVTVYNFDGTGTCKIDVNYSGSLFPVGNIPAQYNGYFTATTQVQAGTGATNTVMLPSVPDNTTGLSFARVAIYGVQIVNMGSSAETVTVTGSTNGGGCSGGIANTNNVIQVTLPPGNTAPAIYVLPATSVPYTVFEGSLITTTRVNVVCFNTSTSSATHNLFALVTYRIE